MNTINSTHKIFLALITGAAVIAVLLFTYSPTFAANPTTATVSATVTVQNITLTVSTGTIAWGTLAVSTASSTNPSFTQTVKNTGNVAEDFNIKGTDSSPWTIGATPGADIYTQQFCTATCGGAPTNYTPLTTTNASLATNIAANGTVSLDLYLQTPTSSTSYVSQSIPVTLIAIAH